MTLDDELRMLDDEILRIPFPYRLATVVVGIAAIGYFVCANGTLASSEDIFGGIDGGYTSALPYDSGTDTGGGY